MKSERPDEEAERAMDDTQPLRFDPSGSVVGLSGLSDKMRGEYGADDMALDDTQQMNIAIASLAPETEAGPKSQVRVGDVPSEFQMSKRPAGSSKYRALYIALALMTAFVAAIGILIITVTHDASQEADYEQEVGDVKMMHNEVVVPAEILPIEITPQDWKLIAKPHKIPSSASRSGVRITNTKKTQDSQGHWWYSATLMTKQYDVIGAATVHLSLVNWDSTEIAAVQFPVSMISARSPLSIHVPLAVLGDEIEDLRVAEWVEVDQKYDHGSYLRQNQVILTPMGEGRETQLRIIAYNQSDKSLRYALFKITAIGEDNEPIASWLVRWPYDIGPNQPAKFIAVTPIESGVKVKSWNVVATVE
ncbi:hypothetical protein JD969_12355 [Planctomycetota bacterium]|nr:hypothetical protein JD969_12355 [Planctomycetota bacterium]